MNMGWRYLIFAIGGLTVLLWALRFFVFPLHESPRYLLSHGRYREAADVVHKVAAYNGTSTGLTAEALERAGSDSEGGAGAAARTAALGQESSWRMAHVRALFSTPKMALSTSLLIALWGECLMCT